MAASADRMLDRRSVQVRTKRGIPVAASSKCYQDTFAGFSSGYARPLTAGDVFAGIFTRQFDNSAGSAGDLTAEIENGTPFQHAVTGVTGVGDVGSVVYASDDQTLTLTSTSNSPVGVIEQYVSSTTCWIRPFTPSEAKIYADGITLPSGS